MVGGSFATGPLLCRYNRIDDPKVLRKRSEESAREKTASPGLKMDLGVDLVEKIPGALTRPWVPVLAITAACSICLPAWSSRRKAWMLMADFVSPGSRSDRLWMCRSQPTTSATSA